jgi:PAS domain S-box-containing protein
VFYRYRLQPDRAVEYVSPNVERLVGYTASEHYTDPDIGLKLVVPDDRALLERMISEPQSLAAPLQLRWRRRDGRVIRTWQWVYPVMDASGAVVAIEGVARELHEWNDAAAMRDAVSVLDALGQPAGVVDTEGRILYCNPRATALLGRAAAQLLGCDMREAVFPTEEMRARVDAIHAALVEGKLPLWTGELDVYGPDEPQTVFATMAPVRNARGAVVGVAGTAVDLRDLRPALEASAPRDATTEYERFFRLSQDLLCIAGFDGYFKRVNPAFTELLGYAEGELLGRPFTNFVHPDDRAATEQAAARASDADVVSFENRYRARDGSYRWLLWKSRPVPSDQLIYAVARDITERKQLEEALRAASRQAESERRASVEDYQTIVDNAPVGILQSRPDGVIVAANPALARILGYASPAQLRAAVPNVTALYVDPAERAEHVVAPLQRGEVVSGLEVRFRRHDGKPTWVQLDAAAVRRADGQTTYESFIRDIHERKSLEEQLLQAQKMEAIGRLAGGVAHDFNNLLTAILGNAELAMTNLDQRDPLREDLLEIERAAKRATALTGQLLAFSRKQVLQPEVIDLNEVITDMQEMLGRLLGEDITLQVLQGSRGAHVRADPVQLQQVLMNLAVNARDAMPDGGTLTLEAADLSLDEAYVDSHTEVRPGEYAVLAVSDTGSGMDAETRVRIFEPFFTTKEVGKGTGLGLSTVYGIVQQSGGHIWVYSEPGQGTVFKIYLPRVSDPGQHAAPRRSPPGVPAPVGTETILLVEDEPAVRELAGRALRRQGYRVIEAANAGEALLRCENMREPLDLLVTDVVMPQMGGADLAERLRQLKPGLRVLFMSGYSGDAVARHGIIPDGVAFLSKPFGPAELAHRVRQALEHGT